MAATAARSARTAVPARRTVSANLARTYRAPPAAFARAYAESRNELFEALAAAFRACGLCGFADKQLENFAAFFAFVLKNRHTLL